MSSAIVPYMSNAALAGFKRGAFRAGMAMAGGKRARYAYAIGSHLYRNRGKYRRAAKVIGRSYRRYRAKRIGMGRIGQVRGVARCKRAKVETAINETNSTRELYFDELTNIERATGLNELDKRQRDVVHISGFKMCFEVSNNLGRPGLFNYAVVYDKRTNDSEGQVSVEDFFRSDGGNERSLPFSTLLTSMQFHCSPLNTDRFTVLWHKRFKLAAPPSVSSDAYEDGDMKSWIAFNKYLKINKKITYDDGHAQSKIWLLRWCDRFQQAATGTKLLNAFSADHTVTAYFREPRA